MAPREKPRRPKQSTGQLMFNTHDPLAEIHRAGRAQEDDHFRKRDQELLIALRAQSAAESEQAIRHYAHMRCPKCGESLEDNVCAWGHDGCLSWVWRDMAGQRGMGRACGAESTRLAPTAFRRADGIQPCTSSTVMDSPLQAFSIQRNVRTSRKQHHDYACLGDASPQQRCARGRHRGLGPRGARADRAGCPTLCTRIGRAHSRCAHHRLSHHPYDSQGPRDPASGSSSHAHSGGSRCPCGRWYRAVAQPSHGTSAGQGKSRGDVSICVWLSTSCKGGTVNEGLTL